MKIIYKGCKFKLLPTQQQKELLAKHFGSVRFVYNYFLGERIRQYAENGRSENYYAQCAQLTQLKKMPGYEWLNEVNSETLTASLRRLEAAFRNFYSNQCNFPHFKS